MKRAGYTRPGYDRLRYGLRRMTEEEVVLLLEVSDATRIHGNGEDRPRYEHFPIEDKPPIPEEFYARD